MYNKIYGKKRHKFIHKQFRQKLSCVVMVATKFSTEIINIFGNSKTWIAIQKVICKEVQTLIKCSSYSKYKVT